MPLRQCIPWPIQPYAIDKLLSRLAEESLWRLTSILAFSESRVIRLCRSYEMEENYNTEEGWHTLSDGHKVYTKTWKVRGLPQASFH